MRETPFFFTVSIPEEKRTYQLAAALEEERDNWISVSTTYILFHIYSPILNILGTNNILQKGGFIAETRTAKMRQQNVLVRAELFLLDIINSYVDITFSTLIFHILHYKLLNTKIKEDNYPKPTHSALSRIRPCGEITYHLLWEWVYVSAVLFRSPYLHHLIAFFCTYASKDSTPGCDIWMDKNVKVGFIVLYTMTIADAFIALYRDYLLCLPMSIRIIITTD